MINQIKKFIKNNLAIAAIEFSFITPIIIMIIVFLFESYNMIQTKSHIESIGNFYLNSLSHSYFFKEKYNSYDQIMNNNKILEISHAAINQSGIRNKKNIQTIFSVINIDKNGLKSLGYQDRHKGDGIIENESKIVNENQIRLPYNTDYETDSQIMCVEVFYQFNPLYLNIFFSDKILYTRYVSIPRNTIFLNNM